MITNKPKTEIAIPMIPNIKPAIPIPLPLSLAMPTIPKIKARSPNNRPNTTTPRANNIEPKIINMIMKKLATIAIGIESIPKIREATPGPFPAKFFHLLLKNYFGYE